MKKWLLFICAFLSALNAKHLSFEEAYAQAIQNNDGLKATQSAVEKQEKLQSAMRFAYLPHVSLSALYVRLQDSLQVNLLNSSQLGSLSGNAALAPLIPHLSQPIALQDQNIVFGAVNIIYPLFTGGKRYFVNKLSDIAFEDSVLALKLKKLNLFEDCVKLYYGVVLSQQILATLEDAKEGHLAHYQNAQKLQEKGQIARIETLQAQVNYNRSVIDEQKARDNLYIAKMALDSMLGVEDLKDKGMESKVFSHIGIKDQIQLENSQYFVARALELYPALQIVDNKIRSARELSRIEMSSFLPEVALFGSYMLNDNSSVLDKALPNWYVGLGAKWSLITPEGRIQKYQASKIASLEAEHTYAQAKKDLRTLSEKTYNEVVSYKQQYFSLNSSIELAQENLKLREKAFLQGMSTSADVSDARNALSLAIIEQQTIAYNYVISLARLMALSDEVDGFYKFLES